ncbi:MAG: NUDIX domain-containing protein [Flavobacteriales bacterium]|nr:NUDIX domain-containing protein [Flavobacteriales bacterium]
MVDRFNIRVYFVIIEDQRVLISDELIGGKPCMKFPGGGMEPGEGTVECAQREAREELNQEICVEEHIYTTDFFQQSAFNAKDQIVSIYYRARLLDQQRFNSSDTPFSFENSTQSFRWISLKDVESEAFTFPIDKIAWKKIQDLYHRT